jgi:hypothetical protein
MEVPSNRNADGYVGAFAMTLKVCPARAPTVSARVDGAAVITARILGPAATGSGRVYRANAGFREERKYVKLSW